MRSMPMFMFERGNGGLVASPDRSGADVAADAPNCSGPAPTPGRSGGHGVLEIRRHISDFAPGVHEVDGVPLLNPAIVGLDHRNGRGITVGLVDTGIVEGVGDLRGANLLVRHFGSGARPAACRLEHGTHSATMLVGQGRHRVRGIAPGARLLFAGVADADGIASADAVADALDWMLDLGVHVVAIPLGDSVAHARMSTRIVRAARAGAMILAAAGNDHPDAILYPASHPLVVAVGAADRHGRILPDCCRTPHLDLIAPGQGIASLVAANHVSPRSGSSVACVVAAAAAVLALAADSAQPLDLLTKSTSRSPLKEGHRSHRVASAD